MPYLAIVRHGVSQANIDGIIAGHFDTPLTDKGRQQARQAAELLRDIPFHSAHGSTLQRAAHTLEEIASTLNLQTPTTLHDDLRERNWGTLEGKYSDNRNDDFTEEEKILWQTWGNQPPEGESYEVVSERMVGYFKAKILPELIAGQNVLLVAHNGCLKTLQGYLEGVPLADIHTLQLGNAEAKVYRFEDGKVVSVELRSIHK